MLKSTFKKVSAIAIAGTMLAGMMAVPANAMTEIMEDYQASVWSQDFTGIEDKSVTHRWQGSASTGNVFVEGKMKYSADTYAYTTMKVTEDKKLQLVAENEGNSLLLSVFPESPVALTEGKKSNINFDFCMSDIIDYTVSTTANKKWLSRSIGVNSTGLTGTDLINFGQDPLPASNVVNVTFAGGSTGTTIDPGTTYNFNIEIDRGANTRTLTIKNGATVVSTIVASGATDIASINDVYFVSKGYGKGHTTTVDNINITTADQRSTGEFTSDLSKTVLEEDFTNFTGSVTHNGALTGTKFTMSTPGWATSGTDFTVTANGGAAKTSATKSTITNLVADFDDVTLDEGEAIRFSFDITKDAGVLANVGSKSMASPTINLTSLDETRTSDLTGDTTNVQMHFINNGIIRPGRLQTSTDAMMLEGYTYHFEYTIVPSNPAHGNKQTLTVNVTSPDNALTHSWQTSDRFDQYKETFYLDADRGTDGEQKFDSLSRFYFTNYFTSADGTIDNVKVEVIKPGFEVVDVNNQGNTYTFSGNDDINLNYVTNASAASKVIIAQYDNTGRLISATPQAVAATGRDTVTVTPVANANLIKLMILDMSTAAPYAKVFKLTKE